MLNKFLIGVDSSVISTLNKHKIEFEPYLAYGIATNPNACTDLDDLIKKFNIDYTNITKNSKYLIEKLYICSRFEVKYYFIKALALIIMAKREPIIKQDFERLLRKNWRSEYLYVTGTKNINLIDYLNSIAAKGDFTYNAFNSLIKMYILLYFTIRYTENYSIEEIKFLSMILESTDDNVVYKKNVNEIFNKDRKNAKIMLKLLEDLTGVYFNSTDLGIACPAYLPDIKGNNLINNILSFGIDLEIQHNTKPFPKKIEYGLTKVKQLNILITSILAKSNIDLKTLNISLKKEEQLDIMLMLYRYLKMNGIKLDKFHYLDEMDQAHVYLDLLNVNLILNVVMLLSKLHKEEENFFKTNFIDNLGDKFEQLKQDNNNLHNKILRLEYEKEKLLDELESFKNENKRLSQELDKHTEDSKELLALRSYLFNSTSNIQNENYSDEDFSDIIYDLKTVKVTIVGGTNTWINRMKNLLPEWNYISIDQVNFDTSLLDTDWVVINSVQNMHKLYYKAKENTNANLAIISKVNVELACKEIHKIIFGPK
ncbi:hypothetical protein ACSW9K_15725 (plasmid) [Clostridium perfringens]|uniref:DUF2325 domain-containing protein n=2 Tax=Clostridium perfringens TaxID=1502 RepID=A0A8H9QY14_CLOPF|nr:hypothetical protein [Clostridium perfringens]MDU7977627.1 hypothetical protein [Clostridioides difficile]EDT15832.1 hypothetical protein AC3_A0199 [Clostridium perfringens E str. JGS1987]MCX0408582.1 hypothetical protein [Clostridium perfringens]MDU3376192.1 hypothetical protein [Clostridium perfringens]MDU3534148.1 hypothetical protein [Clostridium perfringens]